MLALGAALASSVLVPSLAVGGYTAASRAVFAGLAGATLLVALAWHERGARRMARTAPVLMLAALALIALASAAWSLDSVASLRWGLVIGGYAAVVLAAGVLAGRRRGVEALAVLIAVTAAVTAALGLVGLALHDTAFAERIYGRWRPGGPFQYPPALALVQVCALPSLLYAMARARARVAAAAAGGAALAAGTLALSGSRWQLALGVLVLLAALLFPDRALGAARGISLAAIFTVALSGAAMYLARRYSSPQGSERLADFASVCFAAGLIWIAVPPLAARLRASGRGSRAIPAAAVVVTATVVAAGVVSIAGASDRASREGSQTHGRLDEWRAALDTAADRPIAGYGADTFVDASAPHERPVRARYAHNLPLEAWAELGVLGVAAVLALYAAVGRAVWRARGSPAAWLLGPAALAFLATNLVDWPWHLAGVGALWALAVGGVVANPARAGPG
ncbi:MAG: O-Antigen ligase [Thermoleophilaceae bacterium]|nr:O-Antigen ligase [Thermoleophilaceae bacterium]